jgi:proline racemase
MAPKRKKEDLLLKSIWDESLVDAVITNKKHRNRIWQYLIMHPEQDIRDIPFLSWSVRRDEAEVLQRDFVRYTSKIIQRNESSRGDSIKLLIELQGTTYCTCVSTYIVL